MTLKLQTDEVCRSFQLRRNGGTYIRSVVRTAIVASVVEPRSSAALRSAEFSRIIGNINATLLPALVGLTLGSLTAFVSALELAALFGLPDVMRVSISVKSVTAPVAIALAPIIDGSPTLTATFAVATGMIGAVLGPSLMTVVGIHDPLARGLALGTISHGQGTAQALLEGELQGATAGVAMGLAAVVLAWAEPGPGAHGGWLHPAALMKAGVAVVFFLHGVGLSFAALRTGM